METRDKRRADPGVPGQPEIEGRRVRESIEEASARCRRASSKHDGEVLFLLLPSAPLSVIIFCLSYTYCRYYELKQCFDQNLEEIESVASEERRELLHKNSSQIQKLFELFSKVEQGHVDERQRRVEQQQNDLAALRLHDAEDYTSLKVRLPF